MICYINNKNYKINYTTVFTPPYNSYIKCYYIICTIDDELNIELEYDEPIKSAVIRPLSAGISYTYKENKVYVNLKKAVNISVEVNDELDNAILFFSNNERETEKDKYVNFIKFEKGVHYTDVLTIDKNDTEIYIEEGAVVNGKILINNADNVKIFGGGVLTMKNYSRAAAGDKTKCLDINNSRNVKIYDIGLFDSAGWTCRVFNCDNVKIENVKIIGCRGNSDGIDVCGSRNIHVSECFIRTYDDSFVVKGFDTGNVENVLFEKSVLWNDMARPMEVGVELRCEEVKDIVFRDIDVIHSLTSYPIFGIHHGDRAIVSNIHFENIRIENAPGGQLFDFRITDSVWNKDSKKGNIHDVYADKIYLLGEEGKDFKNINARIETAAREGRIENVYIGDINAYGKQVSGFNELGLQVTGNVENVVLKNSETGYIESKIENIKNFALNDDGMYHGRVKLTITNCSKENTLFKSGINVYPKNKAVYDDTANNYSLAPNETAETEYDIIAPPGKIAIESFGDIVEFKKAVDYEELNYILKNDIDNAYDIVFNDYYGNDYGKIRFALNNGWFTVKSDILKEYDLRIYTAIPCEKKDNQVMFSTEESYFGEAPSVKWKDGMYKTAPEIGNPYEITYVFLNQPDTEINQCAVNSNFDGMLKIPIGTLKVNDNEFWAEVCILNHKRKNIPDTLFRSPIPEYSAHMFCRFICE